MVNALTRGAAGLAAAIALACGPAARNGAPQGEGAEAGRAAVAPAALAPPLTREEIVHALRLAPLPPRPPDPTNRVADDPRAARFGQALFFDTRLSGNGKVACATCHDPTRALADGRALGQGMGTTERHVPAAWNTAWGRWFTWDGRADSAWGQALLPLESKNEHGSSRVRLARVVSESADLRGAYEEIFGPLPDVTDEARFPPDGRPDRHERWHPHVAPWQAMSSEDQDAVTQVFVNLGKAIAAYERLLVSGEAPFDRFVAGLRDGDPSKLAALDEPARRGLALFVGKARCRTCHHGPLLSDGEFHDTRLRPPQGAPRDTARFRGVDLLRMSEFNAAGRWSDAPDGERARRTGFAAQPPESWAQFKTPSLRNVALTAPYAHDGRFSTLAEVLHHYSTLEDAEPTTSHSETTLVAVGLTAEEQADVVRFLGTLTGTPPDPALLRPL